MALETREVLERQEEINRAIASINRVVLGKNREVRLAVACLVARGHLLIEDVPGVGKTLLAHALAQAFGLGFSRVQFTSDLLPSDVLGVSVFDKNAGTFTFHPGPIFSEVVLADEVNRGTPKTQSALLEAMEERQVTVEGATRALPDPFFVIATQNPVDQVGTYPLPESQLDRFLLRVTLGYPDGAAERRMWNEPDRRDMLKGSSELLTPDHIRSFQDAADRVHVAAPLLDYVYRIVAHTRTSPEFRLGLSPRAGGAVVRGAKAWALLEGRNYVAPEDVQMVLPSVVGHRLFYAEQVADGVDVTALIRSVAVE